MFGSFIQRRKKIDVFKNVKFLTSPSDPVCSGFCGGTSGEEPTCQGRKRKRCGFDPWVGKIPWRRAWQPTPVFWTGKFHGQKSLAGYSPWDCPDKNTGVGCHALLQGIFPTQGSNPHLLSLLHCRQILSLPSHRGGLGMQCSTNIIRSR